jgi:hypothetical protein
MALRWRRSNTKGALPITRRSIVVMNDEIIAQLSTDSDPEPVSPREPEAIEC